MVSQDENTGTSSTMVAQIEIEAVQFIPSMLDSEPTNVIDTNTPLTADANEDIEFDQVNY